MKNFFSYFSFCSFVLKELKMNFQNQIIEKAQDLFFKYGLKSITMDDLARELGISKKTLYASFNNKQEILNIITVKLMEEHERNCEEIVNDADNAIQEVLMYINNLKSIFQQFNHKIIFEMKRYYSESWEIFKNYKNDFLSERIKNNLRRGIKEGLYRENINEDIIVILRLEQMQIISNSALFPLSNFNKKEVARELFLQVLYGMSTIKGHQLIDKYMENSEA